MWRGGKPVIILANDGDFEQWRGGISPVSVEGDLHSKDFAADGFIPFEFTADGFIGGRSIDLDCDAIIVDRTVEFIATAIVKEASGRIYPIRKSILTRIYPLT